MIEKVNETECAVCHQPIPKDRIHYGGVSCYSCRAFFRRNTQRDELPVCKNDNNCQITYIDRKQCSACRYTRCLRIGMKPELVLTEDDKKRRFKKFLQKKETESQMRRSDEDDLSVTPPLPPLEATPRFSNFMSDVFQNNLRILFSKRRMEHESKPDVLDLRTDFDNNRTQFPMKTEGNPFSIYPNDHLKIKLEEPEYIKPCVSPAKDYEALKYFKTRGMYQPESASLTSPDKSRVFSVSPANQAQLFAMPTCSIFSHENSLKFNTERKSVIACHPNFKFKTEDIFGSTECTKEDEEDEPKDLSLKRDITESDEDDDDDYKYVHKKFRTQEKSEDDVNPLDVQQCRQSVITHANKITM